MQRSDAQVEREPLVCPNSEESVREGEGQSQCRICEMCENAHGGHGHECHSNSDAASRCRERPVHSTHAQMQGTCHIRETSESASLT